MFCTDVSMVSELISRYTGLLIWGSAFTCLVQSPIFLQIDRRLSHGVSYMYRLWINLFFYWPWPCLSIYPPSSPEPVQWKHLPLLYQTTHGLLSHIYTGLLEICIGIWSQKYWCIYANLRLSYTPPPLKKFQTKFLMDPNQIHLIGEYFDTHGARSK